MAQLRRSHPVLPFLGAYALCLALSHTHTHTHTGVAAAQEQAPLPDKLVAHIIPHSHCDPGWLESFDRYYDSQVRSILNSVTSEVGKAPRRRFVWSESSFFMRWYETADAETRARFHGLVKDGRIEFVGGGWVQNDEANPSYDAVLSQLAEGHEYLLSLFGKKPRIAWSIDPFGSSSATAAISALAGFDALVINRVEHGVKDALKARAAMEFVWKPYATSPAVAEPVEVSGVEAHAPSYTNVSIFTHILHTHYSAPRGFDFESPEGVHVNSGNVANRARELAQELRRRALAYRSSHLLVPFGDDFKFMDAATQFRNMDAIVDYVTAHTDDKSAGPVYQLEVRYSTLSEYFDAVWAEAYTGRATEGITSDEASAAAAKDADQDGAVAGKIVFPVLSPTSAVDGGVDFFPYADNDASWWVGYYTSRPLLKQMIRRAFYSVHAADALMALVRPWAGEWQTLARHVVTGTTRALAASINGTAIDAEDDLGDLLAAHGAALSIAPYASFSWTAVFQRLEAARLDAALCLHHDAITGTSRGHVVEDYTQRMIQAVQDATSAVADLASMALGGLPKTLAAVANARETAPSNAAAVAASAAADMVTLAPAPLTHVPHVLPILSTLPYAALILKDGALAGVSSSMPGHPVVVYNPTAWRRKTVVSAVFDIGSAASNTQDAPCARYAWPIGLVVDDERRPVRSDWVAVPESMRAAKDVFDGYAGRPAGQDSTVQDARGRTLMPVEPRSRADASSRGKVADVVASGTRYELAFEVDVPAYGLATYYVVAAWDFAGAPQPRSDDDVMLGCASPSTSRFAAAFAATTPTLVVVPGLGVADAPADKASTAGAVASDRMLAVDPSQQKRATGADTLVMENVCMRVEIDAQTGLLQAITHKHSRHADRNEVAEVRVPAKQTFGIYSTYQSGAYIFRPVSAPNLVQQTALAGSEPADSVTVALHTSTGRGRQGGLLHVARVVGKKYSQTLRLVDTLSADADSMDPERLADACADPLVPDATLDVRPTVSAGGNEEIVMIFEAGIDVSSGSSADGLASPNIRDQTSGANRAAALDIKAGDARHLVDDAGTCVEHSTPHGWWTSDGMALLRRRPAAASVSDSDIQRYYYPLNTLSRVAGPVADVDAPASSWLTLYSAQPFGTTARAIERGAGFAKGVRLEVMLHRHLLQDDGRGLATGVNDGTVLTARLALHIGAEVHAACSRTSQQDKATAERGKPAVRGVDGVGTAHTEWLWAWATRATLHHQSLVTLHADASDELADHDAHDATPRAAHAPAVQPPLDASTHHANMPMIAAEPAHPIQEWARRFATRYSPIQSDAWILAGRGGDIAREDRYPPDLARACDASSAGRLAQVCHHIPGARSHDVGNDVMGGGSSRNGLPPWLHILTLQSRDAVTDDVVLRLQNFGGPASIVDAEAVLGGSHVPRARATHWSAAALSRKENVVAGRARAALRVSVASNAYAHVPLRINTLRARSLTLNRHESYAAALDGGARLGAHRHRLAYPSVLLDETASAAMRAGTDAPLALAGVFAALQSRPDAVRRDVTAFLARNGAANVANRFRAATGMSMNEMLGPGANQNTEEDGVFLSDAALKKKREDEAAARKHVGAGARGRRLLQLHTQPAPLEVADHDVTVAPASIRTFVAVIEADTIDPDDLVAALPAVTPPAPARNRGRRVTDAETDVHAANEARENLVRMISELVKDQTERQAMLDRVEQGMGLTKAQEGRLRRLEVKPNRPHNQEKPRNLDEMVRRLTNVAGTETRSGHADPDVKSEPEPVSKPQASRMPFPNMPARDPWPAEGETEQSLARLLRVLQSKVHHISTGWTDTRATAGDGPARATLTDTRGHEPPAAEASSAVLAPELFDPADAIVDRGGSDAEYAAAALPEDAGEDFVVALALIVIVIAGSALCCGKLLCGGSAGAGPVLPTSSQHGGDSSFFGGLFGGLAAQRTVFKRVVNSSKVA